LLTVSNLWVESVDSVDLAKKLEKNAEKLRFEKGKKENINKQTNMN